MSKYYVADEKDYLIEIEKNIHYISSYGLIRWKIGQKTLPTLWENEITETEYKRYLLKFKLKQV